MLIQRFLNFLCLGFLLRNMLFHKILVCIILFGVLEVVLCDASVTITRWREILVSESDLENATDAGDVGGSDLQCSLIDTRKKTPNLHCIKDDKCLLSDIKAFPLEDYSHITEPTVQCWTQIKNLCLGFKEQNKTCTPNDSETKNISCIEGLYPVGGDVNNGCGRACPTHLGYQYYQRFGCLKEHTTIGLTRGDARQICISEGGDLFTPGSELPLLPKNEMNLGNKFFWIAIRRYGGSGLYKRISSPDESVVPNDSPLWDPPNEPNLGSHDECVLYRSASGLLRDIYCTIRSAYFICQI